MRNLKKQKLLHRKLSRYDRKQLVINKNIQIQSYCSEQFQSDRDHIAPFFKVTHWVQTQFYRLALVYKMIHLNKRSIQDSWKSGWDE